MAFPSPTVAAGTTPYFKGTTTHVLLVPTIATPGAPTAAEITAGRDVTAQVMAINGFELSTASLDLNLLGSGFTGSVGGRTTPGDCSIMFELSSTGPAGDVRSTLTPATLTNVVFANEGFTTGMSIDIWPARIGQYSPPQDTEAVAGVTVPFFCYVLPSRNVSIPTA